jgi:hypothetical protein
MDAPPCHFSLDVSDCLCEEQFMHNHGTAFLLTAVCAAFSLKAQVVTSQVNTPLNTTVSVNSGTFSDRVTLSGSMSLISQITPGDACLEQQPGCPGRIISTLIDVSGASMLTGIFYRATGTSIFSIPPIPVARGGITFIASYQLAADALAAWLGVRELPSITLPISVGLNSNGQMTSASVPSGGVLWLGTLPATVTATDTSGSILGTGSAPVSGIAFDGTNLWFSDPFGNLTKRTSDGNTVLTSFPGGAVENTKDMAWDSQRQRLWRAEFFPPALERIDPATGTIESTIPLSAGSAADPLYPRAAVGVAYDASADRLYVSFCKAGCATLGGVVAAFDAGTGAALGDLFSTSAYLIGGLAFDPVTGNLWVGFWNGFNPVIANMTLGGVVNSSFSRNGPFVDGLEFIGSASTH